MWCPELGRPRESETEERKGKGRLSIESRGKVQKGEDLHKVNSPFLVLVQDQSSRSDGRAADACLQAGSDQVLAALSSQTLWILHREIRGKFQPKKYFLVLMPRSCSLFRAQAAKRLSGKH